MKHVAILDVDGTLMDTNYFHVEAWARALQAVKQQVPRAIIHRQIGKGSNMMLDELLHGDEVKERANDLHGEFYEKMQQYGLPLPGAKELIAKLSSESIAIWLATSAKSEELDHHLEMLDVGDKLAGIVSSEDVAKAKPAPHIFQETLRRSKSSPDESIVVGDTVWDIQAAQDSGLQTLAVMTGGAFSRLELQEAGALNVYRDCEELVSVGFREVFLDMANQS